MGAPTFFMFFINLFYNSKNTEPIVSGQCNSIRIYLKVVKDYQVKLYGN